MGGYWNVPAPAREGLTKFPALLGAVIFSSLPKLFAHYGAGHLSLLYAVSWTPWLLYTTRKYFLTETSPGSPIWRRIVRQPAWVWAMILLADVRWAAYAGMLWWYYCLFHLVLAGRRERTLKAVSALIGQTLLGILLASPLLLPLIEYAGLSTRASMTAEDVSVFSLPLVKVLGFLFPDFGGFYEGIVYCGALVIVLMFAGFGRARQVPATRCWLGAALFSLIFALGSSIPFFATIAELPGFNLLRVPSRMIFVTGFSLAALAAHQLHWLISGVTAGELRRSRLALVGLLAFVLLLAGGAWMISRKPPVGFIWGSVFFLLGVVWLILLMQKRLAIRIWQIGLLALCWIDLCAVNLSLFTTRPVASVLAEGEQAAVYLSHQPGEFRVYSPSYSLPQQTSAFYGLEMASGVDPLQLQGYASYMEAASGIQPSGYSVVLPPLEDQYQATGDPPTPDLRLLGFLNVGYILSDYPLHVDGLDRIAEYENKTLYKNRVIMPRAWVELDGKPTPAIIESMLPNEMRIQAQGPGLLVLAEILYPGWNAWVDNQPVTILESHDVLRSVQLDDGEHEIVFRYRPTALIYGMGLCLLGLILTAVWGRVIR